tara:strand:- start:16 stop:255 length:240 start_codon:yes stop_codon:yes gene_type:complete
MTLQIIADVQKEIASGLEANGSFHSLHEAHSILLEEVEEFWDDVKMKASERDLNNTYNELIQIAAVALRTAEQIKDHTV